MGFVLYAAAFRLAVIAAGTACVFMGYRLFVLGVMPPAGSELSAGAGGVNLTLKNAAPGTCFALFGAIVIGLMLWHGNPEVRLMSADGGTELTLRSGAEANLAAAMAHGEALALQGDREAAIQSFASALADPALALGRAAPAIAAIAALWCEQGRLEEAIAYARLAHQVDAKDADVLRLVARIERSRGNVELADRALMRARNIDGREVPADRCGDA